MKHVQNKVKLYNLGISTGKDYKKKKKEQSYRERKRKKITDHCKPICNLPKSLLQ